MSSDGVGSRIGLAVLEVWALEALWDVSLE
jgi:hypothetical protein